MTRAGTMLLIVAAGCGRLGYDGVDDRDGSVVDGDGSVAADAAPADPNSIPLVTDPENSRNPRLAWTGSQLGLAWDREVGTGSYDSIFARFKTDGTREGDIIIAVDSRATMDLAWSVERYAWLYSLLEGNRTNYYVRFIDALGVTVDGPTQLGDTPHAPRTMAVDYDDVSLAAAYFDNQGGQTLRLEVFDNSGNSQLGPVVLDSFGGSSGGPSIARGSDRYAISWSVSDATKQSGGFVRLVDLAGTPLTDPVLFSPPFQTRSQVVWTGSAFIIAWTVHDNGESTLNVGSLDEAGTIKNARAFPVASTGMGGLDMAWSGSELGLAWADNRDGNYEIYFASVGGDLSTIKSPTRLTISERQSSSPSIVSTPTGYLIAYVEGERFDGGEAIYLVAAP